MQQLLVFYRMRASAEEAHGSSVRRSLASPLVHTCPSLLGTCQSRCGSHRCGGQNTLCTPSSHFLHSSIHQPGLHSRARAVISMRQTLHRVHATSVTAIQIALLGRNPVPRVWSATLTLPNYG